MTTNELKKARDAAVAKVAGLNAKADEYATAYTEANVAIFDAAAGQIDALVSKRAAAAEGAKATQTALESARNAANTAHTAYAQSRGPEAERERDVKLAAVIVKSAAALAPLRADAQAVAALEDELSQLNIPNRRPRMDLRSPAGVLMHACGTAVHGSGDGLIPVMVVRPMLTTANPLPGIEAGRLYSQNETLRLPEATASQLLREGHVALADVN